MLGRKMLVSAQIALSLTILVGAGLFVRTLVNLQRQDAGLRDRTSGIVLAESVTEWL